MKASHANTVHIIGGGLGGLAASLYLAKAGLSVHIYEQSEHLGGRARSQAHAESVVNLGPHALYRKGGAARVLRELGIQHTGGLATGRGAQAVYDGSLFGLPLGLGSMLGTDLLRWSEKLQLGRVMAALPRIRASTWRGQSVDDWVQSLDVSERVQSVLHATIRISSYCNAPDLLDAGAAVTQLQRAMSGVWYLDGGWQSLTDSLYEKALALGVRVHRGRVIQSLDAFGDESVIVATQPAAATKLTGIDFNVTPVRAACLNLVLSSLPNPAVPLALGIDTPLYLSNHSRYADLGEHHVLHAAKYLAPDDDGQLAKQELEDLLEQVQPGWRSVMLHQQFMPRLTVVGALFGTNGRPASQVVVNGRVVQLVGDWVGDEGMLADAALLSARAAAFQLLAATRTKAA